MSMLSNIALLVAVAPPTAQESQPKPGAKREVGGGLT